MKDKFVLDSSVWISLERSDFAIQKIVGPMISNNQICLVDIITAEVLRGVLTKKDFDKLSNAFSSFTTISTDWHRVAELAFRVAKKGFMPPLVDIYIAQSVFENKKTLVTQDKHFKDIQKSILLDIMFV